MSQEKTTLPSFDEVYDRIFVRARVRLKKRPFATQVSAELMRQMDSAFLNLNRSLLDANGHEVSKGSFRSALVHYGMTHLSEIVEDRHGTNALTKISLNRSEILRYAEQNKVSEIALYGNLTRGYLPEGEAISFLIVTKPDHTLEHYTSLTRMLKHLLYYDVLLVDKNALEPERLKDALETACILLPYFR